MIRKRENEKKPTQKMLKARSMSPFCSRYLIFSYNSEKKKE